MRRVTAGLALVAVLAAAVLGWEITVLRPRHADVEQQRANRASVLQAAQRFVVLANTYEAASFEQTTQAVAPLLSTKFRASYVAANQDLRSLVARTKLASKGTALKSAVASLDDDSAAVLVIADASTTSSVQATQRHFRWQVELVKVGGRWLVDDFEPVVDPDAATGAAAP